MLDRRAMDLLDTRRPRLLLLAFCLLTWLPGLFTLPPTDRDESRFAQASKQMIESGDYVRIMNGEEARNRKPIGIYWLQVPFAKAARSLGLATANPIWPYRLPSLLGGLLAVLATYEIGLTLADRRAALLAAGMLAASAILVVEAHLAKTDAALLGATTLAMAMLVRAALNRPVAKWQAALFWLAMGAGILLKGPITPMVAGLTAASFAAVQRRAAWLRALRPLPGVALMLLVVLPWFVAIGLATHGAFFTDAVGGDLGRKLASGDDAHGAPPGTHLLLLPLLAFPATLPVLAGLPRWWRERRDPAAALLLCWIVPSWIVFEAVPTKLPHYHAAALPGDLFAVSAPSATLGEHSRRLASRQRHDCGRNGVGGRHCRGRPAAPAAHERAACRARPARRAAAGFPCPGSPRHAGPGSNAIAHVRAAGLGTAATPPALDRSPGGTRLGGGRAQRPDAGRCGFSRAEPNAPGRNRNGDGT